MANLHHLFSCCSPLPLPTWQTNCALYTCLVMLSCVPNLLCHLSQLWSRSLLLSVHFCNTYTSCQRSLLESGTGLQDSDFSYTQLMRNTLIHKAKSVLTCLWIFILYIAERKIASGALFKCFQLGITFLKSKPLYLQACCCCQSQPLF